MKAEEDERVIVGRLTLYRFFFFQAEDGIRALYVTGVQTCALPIFQGPRRRMARGLEGAADAGEDGGAVLAVERSEERRVGKERRRRDRTGRLKHRLPGDDDQAAPGPDRQAPGPVPRRQPDPGRERA